MLEIVKFTHLSLFMKYRTGFRFQIQPPIFDHDYYWPSASINDMAPAHNCKHCCQVQPQAVSWPQKKDTFHSAVKISKDAGYPFSQVYYYVPFYGPCTVQGLFAFFLPLEAKANTCLHFFHQCLVHL